MKPMPKLKFGQTLSLRVEDLSDRAQGVATLGGNAILVKEGLPGDQVQAVLMRVKPHLAEAKLLKVDVPSLHRIVPRCQHFGPCGGCSLQHMAYGAQVEWKAKMLLTILSRERGLSFVPPIRVVPSEDPWGYRNKMEFSFGQQGERVTLGLHQKGSFERVEDVVHCHIAPGAVSELLQGIKELVNRFPLKSYNPKTHQGFWRYAVVRSSLHRGELMLLLMTNDGPESPLAALAQELPRRVPALKSFYWGVSTRVSDVAVPERMQLLTGSQVLDDQVGEIRFQIKPTNFVQPNLSLAAQIYEAISRAADLTGVETVYDLYCGIGLIALSLAGKAKAVYGVESDPENVALAERSAALNRISNTAFLCGKVEDLLKGRALFKAGPKPNVIVVDPPRAGLHKEVYAPLLSADAKILMYLSCNPASLARDLAALLSRDPRYRIDEMTLFDFFPHTAHMEILVTLRRQS